MWRAAVIALVLATASPALAQPIAPQISETFRTEYYELRGQTPRALHAALEARREDGAIGETGTRITFQFTARDTGEQCELTGLSLTLDIVVIYPRWSNRKTAPADLQLRWDVFLDALTRHEEGHARMAREGAADIARQLAASPPAPDCVRLRTQLGERYDGLRAALEARQRAYDRDTEGGRTQGAYLRFNN